MTARKIPIEKIVVDPSLYPRGGGVNESHLARMVHALSTPGTKFPPILVEAKTLRLVDGRHRYEASLKVGLTTIEIIEKVYKSEADLFADGVRANVQHGQPMDSHSVRAAIIRLEAYGYTKEQIGECVRLPLEQIVKIERGFASDSKTGEPVALKGGLSHLKGTQLTEEQKEVNRAYGGGKATFYVRQTIELLENNMQPKTKAFIDAMDNLTDLWARIKKKVEASAA